MKPIYKKVLIGLLIIVGIIRCLTVLPKIIAVFNNTIQNSNKNLCKKEALGTLKSPGSAQFGNNRQDGAIAMKNYVDSQNSYGALLRTHFICRFMADDTIEVIFEDDASYKILNEIFFKGID